VVEEEAHEPVHGILKTDGSKKQSTLEVVRRITEKGRQRNNSSLNEDIMSEEDRRRISKPSDEKEDKEEINELSLEFQ
jgi:hypothetical protein